MLPVANVLFEPALTGQRFNSIKQLFHCKTSFQNYFQQVFIQNAYAWGRRSSQIYVPMPICAGSFSLQILSNYLDEIPLARYPCRTSVGDWWKWGEAVIFQIKWSNYLETHFLRVSEHACHHHHQQSPSPPAATKFGSLVINVCIPHGDEMSTYPSS